MTAITTTPITVASNYFGQLGWMAWMGPNAQVDPQSMSVERPTTLRSSIGGFTVGIQSPRSHREWKVDVPPCQPSDLAPVLAYIDGEFGQGPWWWVPEDAARSNLLPPRAGVLDIDAHPWSVTTTNNIATDGGPVRLAPDGTIAGRSLLGTTSTGWMWLRDRDASPMYLPVVPGVPVTFSAYLASPEMQLQLVTKDADNTTIDIFTAAADPSSTATAMARASATAPSEAITADVHHVLVAFQGTNRMTRPAVSWTDQMVDYGAANGCPYAIISADTVDQNTDVLLDQNCPPIPGRWPYATSASYTITEVA